MTGIDLDTLSRTQKRLLNLIKNNPGITRKELLKNIDVDRRSLSANLRKLEDYKIVWKIENNGAGIPGYEYITQKKLKQMVYKRLLMRLLDDEIDEDQFHKVKAKLESLDTEQDTDL